MMLAGLPSAHRITGSPDLFAARWGEGWPGSLATPRLPAWGLNGASLLSQSSLQDAVASLLPAPVGAAAPPGLGGLRATLAKTLLMAVMFMQVRGPSRSTGALLHRVLVSCSSGIDIAAHMRPCMSVIGHAAGNASLPSS